MKKIIPVPLFIFFFSAGTLLAQTGEQKGWPSADRYAFITECIKSAKVSMGIDSARFYCYCMQEKVETKYPLAEESSKLTAEELATPGWQQQIKSCLYGFWTTEDREAFLTNCIPAAKSGLGEEKAKNYCECMLYKMELKYPVVADAEKITEEDMQKPDWQKIIQGCLKF